MYAISATTLDGVPLALPSTYDWFRHRAPQARIGRVMLLYDVAETHGEWVAQCSQPVTPLSPDIVAEGFGSRSLRLTCFDCEQSWLFPAGGAEAGWYVRAVPGDDRLRWPVNSERLDWWPDWVRQLPISSLHLSYVQPTASESPPFAIWEWGGTTAIIPSVSTTSLEETLEFIGFETPETARTGDPIEVLTYWRVLATPQRPLSLMLHLTTADFSPVAVGDGLGLSIDQWQAGDVFVQRHTMTVPDEAVPGAYHLVTGAYWLDSPLEHAATRLQAEDGRTEVVLGPINIRD